jgi:hypothetical protein
MDPDPGGPKAYGSHGSGSATLDKQLCIVATEGFFLQFGHSVVVAAVRCGFGYHLENLVKKVGTSTFLLPAKLPKSTGNGLRFLTWKSRRIKVHSLTSGFQKHFSNLGLALRFT